MFYINQEKCFLIYKITRKEEIKLCILINVTLLTSSFRFCPVPGTSCIYPCIYPWVSMIERAEHKHPPEGWGRVENKQQVTLYDTCCFEQQEWQKIFTSRLKTFKVKFVTKNVVYRDPFSLTESEINFILGDTYVIQQQNPVYICLNSN